MLERTKPKCNQCNEENPNNDSGLCSKCEIEVMQDYYNQCESDMISTLEGLKRDMY